MPTEKEQVEKLLSRLDESTINNTITKKLIDICIHLDKIDRLIDALGEGMIGQIRWENLKDLKNKHED